MRLGKVAEEIASVIGRDAALHLIGQLPRCYPRDNRIPAGRRETVIMYVPKTLKPDHALVRILGWDDAYKLSRYFGGEILSPGNCLEVYRPFRDEAIVSLVQQGVPSKTIAEWFDVSDSHVKKATRRIPQEDLPTPSNDNARVLNQTRAQNGQQRTNILATG